MNNEKKFLPIGTVCKYGNENVMIVGYFNNNNFDVQRKYEYVVCDYPTGVNGSNYKYINHYEIEGLVQVGYRDEKFNALNEQLLALKNKRSYVFDANGFVVEEIEEPEIVENPFVQPVNEENKVETKSTSSSEWPIFSNIVFDANGFVVEAEEIDYSKDSNEETNIKFDENGFVVEDGVEERAKEETNIKFDENGFVVEDGEDDSTDTSPKKESKIPSNIKFDENGFVIAE